MAALIIAEVPALPLHTAGKYVAGAYIVLFLLVLIYVAIMGLRLTRMQREVGELLERAEKRQAQEDHTPSSGTALEQDSTPTRAGSL